jgi:uncharacterized protein YeeX (DUF496 family)
MRKYTKSEGPFKQVSGAHYSLMKMLKIRFENLVNKTLFGYGVLFPDFDFKKRHKETVEWDNDIIYDLEDRMKPFAEYVKRLLTYWGNKHYSKQNLSKTEIEDLVKYLRGDFEFVQPLSCQMEDIDDQIIKLTEQQYKALDRMEYNRRVFFRGTAGTGKTLLAVEKAKRLATSGKKVLFICFNRILGGKLRTIFKGSPGAEFVTADSLHRYFRSIIEKTSLISEFNISMKNSDGDEIYKTAYPEFFSKALNEICEEYDYLIVDYQIKTE